MVRRHPSGSTTGPPSARCQALFRRCSLTASPREQLWRMNSPAPLLLPGVIAFRLLRLLSFGSLKGHSSDSLPLPSLTSARLLGPLLRGFGPRTPTASSTTLDVVPPLHGLNWDNFAPVKVKVFIWILRHRRMQTRARLFCLGILSSSDCPFCAGVPEDVHHLFVSCPRLLSIWAHASPASPTVTPSSLEDMINVFCDTL
jgi:hypothetical protein